ncbi:hypothetical protein WJX82_006468 [Trebouxia sp. C0006]
MFIGNTGVGKSSLGNRVLGCLPSDNVSPFLTAASNEASNSGRHRLQQHEGMWFGETPRTRLVVVDTPELQVGPGASGEACILTEEQIQEHIKNEVLRSFQRWSNIGAAPNFDPVRFKDVNTFLLNSNYLVATGASDAEAFDAFRDRCMSLGEIHRDDLSQGVLPVHPELQQALAALEESQAAIARASEDRQEMLERMRAEAAAAQQAANKRHQHEITAIRLAALEESVKALTALCQQCRKDITDIQSQVLNQNPSLRRSGSMQAPNQGSGCSIM